MLKPYYQQDGQTIYHGDCRAILPELEPVDLVLTDPPYGLGERWTGGTWGAAAMYSDARRWDIAISQELIDAVIGCGQYAIVWGGNYYGLPPCRGMLSWMKVPSMNTMADFEFAWTTFDRPAKAYTTHRNPDGKRVHPTQKPSGLMKWCIQQAGDGVATILDPFMGSGTTLRAAKDLGRKCVGIEIEERYCEIAANRLAQGVLDFECAAL